MMPRAARDVAKRDRLRAVNRASDVLCTWGEIAAELHVCERTARTYARVHGLPVKKIGVAKNSTIIASKRDVEKWVRAWGK